MIRGFLNVCPLSVKSCVGAVSMSRCWKPHTVPHSVLQLELSKQMVLKSNAFRHRRHLFSREHPSSLGVTGWVSSMESIPRWLLAKRTAYILYGSIAWRIRRTRNNYSSLVWGDLHRCVRKLGVPTQKRGEKKDNSTPEDLKRDSNPNPPERWDRPAKH